MKQEVLAVNASEQAAVFAQYSSQCQEFFIQGAQLAPGYTVEQSESQATNTEVSDTSGNTVASTCKTTTYTATKHTALGFVAYKFHAHMYRCYDGSRLWSPSMWTTFSEVDGLMQIQSYLDQNDYWNPYDWKRSVYEQRQVKNCLWTGCIGTFYPTASGWMTGSGSTYLEISAG